MFLLLQLSDGTFPSGGFAHSAGLEAATVLGWDGDLEAFLDASLRQLAYASLPFVRAAAKDPRAAAAIDDALDATMPLATVNKASRAQGRALLRAARGVWPALEGVTAAHHAVVFGAIFGTLGEAPDAPYLHGSARGILSAAVRLGLVGPLEAQTMLAARAALLGELVGTTVSIEDAAATAPLLEVHAGLHDKLDGRMFQS